MEKQSGNQEGAYCAGQTFKQIICPNYTYEQDINLTIIRATLSDLFNARFHPHYYQQPSSERKKLADIIGFDVDGSEIESFGFCKSYRDQHRNLARPSLIIPDITEFCREGILTRAINTTEATLRREGRLLVDTEKWKSYLQREELNITVDELREIFLDRLLYGEFIIGYCLPKIEPNTRAEEYICKYVLGQV